MVSISAQKRKFSYSKAFASARACTGPPPDQHRSFLNADPDVSKPIVFRSPTVRFQTQTQVAFPNRSFSVAVGFQTQVEFVSKTGCVSVPFVSKTGAKTGSKTVCVLTPFVSKRRLRFPGAHSSKLKPFYSKLSWPARACTGPPPVHNRSFPHAGRVFRTSIPGTGPRWAKW